MAKSIKKYMGAGDVRNAIRRLGKQMAAELKDEEIWMSSEFRHYCTRIADFILRKHKLYSLDVQYDPSPDAFVAYTDGKKIVLNTGNCLANKPKLLEGRFKVNMGILFHECAHKLFLDFDTHNKGMNALRDGKFYGEFDIPAGSDLEDNLHDMEQAMADGYRKTIAYVYKEVLNIINDGHDEASMKKCFPGFIAQCINAAGDVQMEESTSLEENVAKEGAELSIFFSLMLQYAKFGYCNIGQENDATEPYTLQFSKMEPVIDEALQEDNYKARWTHINTLVLLLWPTVRKILDNQDDSNGGGSGSQGGGSSGGGGNSGGGAGGSSGAGGSGGSGQMTDEEAEALIQSLAEAVQADNSASQAPTGSGKSVDSQALAAAQNGISSDGADGLASIMDQLGQEKAADAVQGEIDQAQLEAIRKTNRPMVHANIPVDVERHHVQAKERYDEMYQEVAPYVRNLISEVQALLREYNEEALQRHKKFGPIIEATEAYRPDGAFFAKKKLPEDRPNMAMCILLDESGSMSGSKMHISKKAMVMLERFAAGVGVPLMVAGHYASGAEVTLNIYTDYVSARPEQDRYALAAITSHGCNRDGLPIRLCADMLAQRPEDIRLMVVISDGAPNDWGYGGEEAFADIRKTVAEFRRKGLLIYGAAIDDDREVIQSLYGQGFLSITDLKSLPKTMVRLLRQNIV